MRALHTARAAAAMWLALLCPAALFMAAVVVGEVPALHDGAQRIVMMYAGKVWTRWVLLLAPPLCVLLVGCATLLGTWNPELQTAGCRAPLVGDALSDGGGRGTAGADREGSVHPQTR